MATFNQNLVFLNSNQQLLIQTNNYSQAIDLSQEFTNGSGSGFGNLYDPFSTNGLSEISIKKIIQNYFEFK